MLQYCSSLTPVRICNCKGEQSSTFKDSYRFLCRLCENALNQKHLSAFHHPHYNLIVHVRLRLKRGFGQALACAETERNARPFTTACRLCEAATDKQLFLVTFGTPAEASGLWRRCINSLEGPASATSVPSRVELTASGLALLGTYVCTWHARIAITCTTSRYFFLFFFVCAFVFTCFTQPALDRSPPLSPVTRLFKPPTH